MIADIMGKPGVPLEIMKLSLRPLEDHLAALVEQERQAQLMRRRAVETKADSPTHSGE